MFLSGLDWSLLSRIAIRIKTDLITEIGETRNAGNYRRRASTRRHQICFATIMLSESSRVIVNARIHPAR